MGTINSN